jgi:hypothetical protein
MNNHKITDDDARRITSLIQNKDGISQHLTLFLDKDGNPNSEVRIQIAARVNTGMYHDYPFLINLEKFEISQIEFIEFITKKLKDKIKNIDDELSNYNRRGETQGVH